MKTMHKKFAGVIVIAVLLILTVMFIPMFSWGRGTFNFEFGTFDHNFFEVMEFVFRGNWLMSYNEYSVMFPIAAIIPAIGLLIFSLCKVKSLCIAFSLCGIAGVGYVLYRYCSACDYNVELIFGSYASVSIGTWIALLLFIFALIVSIAIRKTANSK